MFVSKKLSKALRNVMFVICSLLLSVGSIVAQDITVTGTVTDKNGEPVVGAYVIIKGTNTGTAVGVDGKYSINVPSSATLVFSSMGYKEAEVKVLSRSVIHVTMKDDLEMLEDAVITAEFGIKRVARTVGSSVQNVKASEISEAGRESFVSALQGRVSGMSVTSSGGSPGSSTTVVLRNITSISGNNQPLYVIDGVPMNNSTFDPVGGFASDDYGTRDLDFASRGNDLNPDDIESMTVLKGAAAAALYGSNASNGAIIITTKKGAKGRGKVTYSNSFRWDMPHGFPELQTKYANGAYGATNYYYTSRYGDEYADGVKLYNNYDAISQTGFSHRHNVAVEGGSDKVTVRGAASFLDQKGIVKTTDYSRMNISLSGKAEITKWLNFESTFMYTNTGNTKTTKGSSGPLRYASRWPQVDDMSQYLNEDGISMKLPDYYTDTDLLNPLYGLYKNRNYDSSDRINANVGLNITPTKNTFIIAKMGWDIGMQKFEAHRHPFYSNVSSSSYGSGSFNMTNANYKDMALNVLAGYNNEWGKFTFAAQAGYHQQENGISNVSTSGSKFQVKDLYAISNCSPSSITTRTNTWKKRLQSISGRLEFGWDNWLFLTVSGRNDWSSTLPIANRSYFYPAVEGSYVFSEMPFMQGSAAVTYLKIRGAWAQVGKDANALAIYPNLEASTDVGGGFKYGFYGPNEALRPEMTTSKEIGFEGRFANDRINTDFTYYWTRCEDQYITSFRLSYATGFVLNNMNVGTFTTQGWEAHIDGDIINSASGFIWNLGMNLSHSTSMVTSLPANVSEYYNAYTWISGNLRNGIMVGHPVTTMTGKGWKRNENGDVLINPGTGLPIIDADWSIMGDRQPLLDYGFTTNLSYKGFRLSALVNGRIGATVVNGTKRDMLSTGSSWESVYQREQGPVVFTGVLQNGLENTSNPTVNNIAVDYSTAAYNGYTGGDEDWLEKDVNFLRLSEVRLSYSLPSSWLKRSTRNFLTAANVWVAGTDLLTLTNYSGIDPVGNAASAALGGSGGIGIDYWGVPNPRGISLGVGLTF